MLFLKIKHHENIIHEVVAEREKIYSGDSVGDSTFHFANVDLMSLETGANWKLAESRKP